MLGVVYAQDDVQYTIKTFMFKYIHVPLLLFNYFSVFLRTVLRLAEQPRNVSLITYVCIFAAYGFKYKLLPCSV